MKKIITFIFCFTAFSFAAQNSPGETARLQKLLTQLEGSFQVQVLNSRDKTEFPLSLLDTVVAKRSKTDTVYVPLKNNVRLMILPLSTINKKEFSPIPRTANIWQ